jgi:hypothetical protein
VILNYSFKVFLVLPLCLEDLLAYLEGTIAQLLLFFDEKPINALHYIEKAEDRENEIEYDEAKMHIELLIV